jgi:O-acetyl-ADP-ribose deacetylase (regulator of RNase III)
VIIEKCDVVKEQADVLVNTANSFLNHDGGLARAFVNAGGNSILEESQLWYQKFGQIAVGGIAVTTAGNIPNA